MRKVFSFVFFIFVLLPQANLQCLHAASEKNTLLAEVNGETIEESSLQQKIKTIHKNVPGVRPEGGAGSLDISDIVEDMIDERLMIQEARRAELDRSGDFEKKMASFVARQSILRLREEVVFDKIRIGEEEILDYFKRHHEKESQAHEGVPERLRKRIEKKLRKAKEKELSDSFVAQLRNKSNIWIDEELVDLLDSERNYTGEKSVIGRINGEAILLSDYLQDIRQAVQRQAKMLRRLNDKSEIEKRRKALKAKTLDRLITYKLIEQEALRRDYTQGSDFVDMVEKRKESLLVNEFKAKLVYPLAIPTEEELRAYYNEHIDEFKKGYEVWFRHMRFQDRIEAEKILEELKQGADFEFLAAQTSEGARAKRGNVWVRIEVLSPTVRKALGQLKVGGFTDIIADGRQFKIVKLKGRRGGEPIEFSKVVERLKRVVGREKFEKVLSEYLSRVRNTSKIKLYKKAIEEVEEKYWNNLPKETETPGSAG
ncbi:MAG: peptidylprolyl isomerase [Planctomycetota bacterium]|jgi:parvulin-like peptidyl-prolyl isomerase